MDDKDRTMDDFKIELFIFPDGTAVEMMVFDRPERGAASSAPDGSSSSLPVSTQPGTAKAEVVSAQEVNICPVCRGDLVHPVDWRRSGESTWHLRLRCPECETERSVVMGRPEVEQLNRELYHGTQELAREAQRVSRQNFEDEARRFVVALQRGDILPIDF
jgi:RNase P subunit RPR2